MARYVKISLIGPTPLRTPFTSDLQPLVDNMIKHWDMQLENVLCDKPDIIVLPEACDRYANFTDKQRFMYYDVRGNQVLDHFKEVCKKHRVHIAYSAARKMPDGSYRNSTQIIDRNGNVAGIYNKNHLVVTEVSDCKILCGKEAPVFELDFGRVSCAICFDLNFAELRNKYEQSRPELILFSSMYHGGLVQNEWAYHCQSYFAGAIAGLPCNVINPLGDLVAHNTNYFNFITTTINLDYKIVHLDFNWQKLKAAKDKYGDKVKILDPGFVGVVMLSSESNEFSADDIIKEFDIELWDEYYNRSLECRRNNIEP